MNVLSYSYFFLTFSYKLLKVIFTTLIHISCNGSCSHTTPRPRLTLKELDQLLAACYLAINPCLFTSRDSKVHTNMSYLGTESSHFKFRLAFGALILAKSIKNQNIKHVWDAGIHQYNLGLVIINKPD